MQHLEVTPSPKHSRLSRWATPADGQSIT